MIELDSKYVLHIPLTKYANDKLIPIDTDGILDEMIDCFNHKGFDSFYITKVKSYYKSRCFDEILITVFTSNDSDYSVDKIFEEWFVKNNNILQQEAFAYEHNNVMFIERI